MTQIPRDLMTAILDNPADDLPRLIIADWLEEHGESDRSEFIRVQIELAELNSNGQDPWPRRRQLETKEGTLFRSLGLNGFKYGMWHFAGDKPKLTETNKYATWRRGFPHSVRCTMADFMPGECECQRFDDIDRQSWIASCDSCHGKRPGLAAVIGGWPVTRVDFIDREPIYGSDGINAWRWYSTVTVDDDDMDENCIGHILYKYLSKELYPPYYSSRELAVSALSDAAVRYARGEWERHAVSLDAALTAPRNEMRA